jgi:hypothetical protein
LSKKENEQIKETEKHEINSDATKQIYVWIVKGLMSEIKIILET